MIDLPARFVGDGRRLLRYRGDDFMARGIVDGDVLVVREAATADPGALVVALDGGRPRLAVHAQIDAALDGDNLQKAIDEIERVVAEFRAASPREGTPRCGTSSRLMLSIRMISRAG